jgi:hypothetical protein
LLELARRAVRTARANLAWAFAYNAIGLPLAATGRLTPIFAASAMVVSSLVVVLSSSRLLRDAHGDAPPAVEPVLGAAPAPELASKAPYAPPHAPAGDYALRPDPMTRP